MNRSILYGIVGLITGALISGIIVSSQNKNSHPVNTQSSQVSTPRMNHNMEGTTMTDMVSSLKGKTGDDFDKTFILGMIEHHQGAIDMANEAKVNAKHSEIKKMADDIIFAQSKEIEMMKQWQTEWNY